MAARLLKGKPLKSTAKLSGEGPRTVPPALFAGRPLSVTLVGFGNLGTALAAALHHAGVPVREVVVRPSKSRSSRSPDRRLIHALGARLTTLDQSKLDAEILWICTPDAEIANVAVNLAARIQSLTPAKILRNSLSARKQSEAIPPRKVRPVVFHASGALASTELAALKAIGSSVASVHPLMTFPRPTRRRSHAIDPQAYPFAGIPFAIEGDARASQTARKLVRALRAEAFMLSACNKPLYHAFATFASPLLVASLTAASKAGVAAGYSPEQARRLMRPIVERTVANYFANGPQESFSGPLARGDAATIGRHLAALRSDAVLADTYRQLGRYALVSLPCRNKQQMRKLLAQ